MLFSRRSAANASEDTVAKPGDKAIADFAEAVAKKDRIGWRAAAFEVVMATDPEGVAAHCAERGITVEEYRGEHERHLERLRSRPESDPIRLV